MINWISCWKSFWAVIDLVFIEGNEHLKLTEKGSGHDICAKANGIAFSISGQPLGKGRLSSLLTFTLSLDIVSCSLGILPIPTILLRRHFMGINLNRQFHEGYISYLNHRNSE